MRDLAEPPPLTEATPAHAAGVLSDVEELVRDAGRAVDARHADLLVRYVLGMLDGLAFLDRMDGTPDVRALRARVARARYQAYRIRQLHPVDLAAWALAFADVSALVMEYMAEREDEEWRLADIADHLGADPANLSDAIFLDEDLILYAEDGHEQVISALVNARRSGFEPAMRNGRPAVATGGEWLCWGARWQ